MARGVRGLVVPAAVALWLGLAASAAAVFPPPVKDDGKFFTKEGLEKANKKIKEIYSAYKVDVVLETYETPPAGKAVPEDREKRTAFFREWADSRAKELGVNGLYILIN